MYKNILKVNVLEDRCKPLKPIRIYQNDAKSNVLEFTIYQGKSKFNIDADTMFRLYMQSPDTLGKKDITYLIQDDESYVTVLANQVGVVQIALSELLVAEHGNDIEIFLELFSKQDPDNTKRFHSFFIDILPQDRSEFPYGRPPFPPHHRP